MPKEENNTTGLPRYAKRNYIIRKQSIVTTKLPMLNTADKRITENKNIYHREQIQRPGENPTYQTTFYDLVIKTAREWKFNVNTDKIWRLAHAEIFEGNQLIEISTKDFQELTGLNPSKSTEALNSAVDLLLNMSFFLESDQAHGGTVYKPFKTVIYGRDKNFPISKRGTLVLETTKDYYDEINTNAKGFGIQVDFKDQYKLTGDAWYIFDIIRAHKNNSAGKTKKGVADHMYIDKLWNRIPKKPTILEIKSTNRNITDRLFKPLEKAMKQILDAGLIESYSYINENGQPIDSALFLDTAHLNKCMLVVEWKQDYETVLTDIFKHRNVNKKKKGKRKLSK